MAAQKPLLWPVGVAEVADLDCCLLPFLFTEVFGFQPLRCQNFSLKKKLGLC